MRPLPLWPAVLCFTLAFGVVVGAGFEHIFGAGLITAFKEYQTFIAAMIALGAAVWAGAPVYRQLQVQAVQTATDLLSPVREDIHFTAGALEYLSTVRATTRGIALATEINTPREVIGIALSRFRVIDTTQIIGIADHPSSSVERRLELRLLAQAVVNQQAAVAHAAKFDFYSQLMVEETWEALGEHKAQFAGLAETAYAGYLMVAREHQALRHKADRLRSLVDNF